MILRDYLLELAQKPDKVAALRADPKAALAASGLSEADQNIVTSADPGKIRAALGGLGAADNVTVVIVIAVL
ncbi:hypothetical protein SAMN05216386_1014 [Nitrosospira briensis]|uniref:Uncharacterized protein n=1 Tax=Nitrosospira briensis TaxID=35799 RepID=A0A1I4Z422_9PROT|nr:hypothetical protein [Nitrosospira briensis]SFN44927.1 hypothetical protein SAMN05216386_1014 [Nitrosospira briensis]